MPIVLLIRHGENDWVGKRLAGRTPGVHLNEKGRQQAQKLAEALKPAPLAAIYSSPLERARETAQPIAETKGLPLRLHDGLQEIHFGEWQGKTTKQMHRLKLFKTVVEKPSVITFPGGESFSGAQARLVQALEEILAGHEKGDLIACISHSDSIKLLVAYYIGLPLDYFQRLAVDTASVTALAIRDGKGSLLALNHSLELRLPAPPQEKPAAKP